MRLLLASACLLAFGACSRQEAAPADASGADAAAPPVQPEAPIASPGDGPPTVDGLYIAKDACPGEGCFLRGKIRAYEAADLFDKAGAGAAVIGKVATGEWVEIVSREAHVAPVRGLVREGRKHFATGDVVYLLTSQGEGCFDVWSRGALRSWCDPDAVGDAGVDEVIDLDAETRRPAGAGLWVEVRRETGAGGWLHGVEAFACTGYQDRDADCPPLPQ